MNYFSKVDSKIAKYLDLGSVFLSVYDIETKKIFYREIKIYFF